EETEKYILHRLQLVGWQQDPSFADGVFKMIFEFTGGVPRRINAMCDRLMLFGCLEEMHELNKDAVLSVIEELEQEVSFDPPVDEKQQGPQLASVSPLHPGSAGNNQAVAPQQAAQPMADAEELIYRIQDLEKEISTLKKTLRNEQKLLRKAILLQMDLDEYDDID
ncbi:MAG: ATPase, partial [Candidatus Thiodiazotropha taylori]|nr:ATPase [Candidatus Thiodiazotropha taylori]MCW4251131.1 ATPase [Candidatus Thiodiazotropha taylori]